MRSIWKGAVSFGLVTIPVGLYTATEKKTPKFKLLRGSDGSPIRYKRVAESDGEEVPWDEMVKGYEVEKGRYVVFTADELEAASVGVAGKLVDVVQFVDQSEIDPIYYQKSYYLGPERTGVKAYKILLQALKESNRVGLAKMALREKQHLAVLRAVDDVLVLETIHWPDEIRNAEFEELEEDVELREEEIKMAEMIIDNLTSEFDAEAWEDQTRQNIESLAQQKIDGEEIVAPTAPEPTKVVDLLDALKASVEATKAKKAAAS